MSRRQLAVVTVAFALLSAGCGATTPRAGAATAEPATRPVFSSAKGQAPADTAAAPAAYNTSATTQPANVATAADIADAFDSQLQRMLSSDASSDPSLAALPADERQLLATVIDSLAAFRMGLRSGDGLMATRVAPLLALVDHIKSQTPLALPTLALCSKVTQFGIYDPLEPPRFAAGKETSTIVYCEVENFASQLNERKQWETRLAQEVVLYTETGLPVWQDKTETIADQARRRRHDFFVVKKTTLPANISIGRYLLKVTIVDQQASRVAEATIPVQFVAQ